MISVLGRRWTLPLCRDALQLAGLTSYLARIYPSASATEAFSGAEQRHRGASREFT